MLHIIKKTFKIIVACLLSLVVLLGAVVVALLIGIKIPHFENKNLRFSQLYLKLDKSLILQIKDLQIAKSSTEGSSANSLEEVSELIKWTSRVLPFFKQIDLTSTKVGDEDLWLFYQDGTLSVKLRFLDVIASDIEFKNEKFYANLNWLNLKDIGVSLNGNIVGDIKNRKFKFDGAADSFELVGTLSLNYENEKVSFKVTDANASSLENFMTNIRRITNLSNDVSSWIYGKVVAKHYFVKEFSGSFDTAKGKMGTLYGEAVANELDVKFHPALSPVKTTKTHILFKDGALFFTLFDPVFEGLSVDGSRVEILDLLSETNLKVHIKTKAQVGARIKKILAAYGVNLPVATRGGALESYVLLDFKFAPFQFSPSGHFVVKGGQVALGSSWFGTKGAVVELKNSRIEIKNATLSHSLFSASANGTLDLVKKHGEFSGKFSRLCIAANCLVLSARSLRQKLTLDFSHSPLVLAASAFGFKMELGATNIVEVSDLSKVARYSPLAKKLGIYGGHLQLSSRDFKRFNLAVLGAKFRSVFSDYHSDNFYATISNGVLVRSESKKVEVDVGDEFVNLRLKDATVDLGSLLENETNSNLSKNSSKNSSKDELAFGVFVNLRGQNSRLKAFERTVKLDKFHGYLTENGTIYFGSKVAGGELFLKKSGTHFTLNAKDIGATFVNELIGREIFDGGKFRLLAGGSLEHFDAQVEIKQSVLKGFSLYQNLLAFIDSVPSLLKFKTPDFRTGGFFVKEGVIRLTKNGDVVHISAAELKGSHNDIYGWGEVDVKTGVLNGTFEIGLFKSASDILSKIPLVGYILMGEKKRFYTVLTLGGTFKSPVFKRQTFADFLKIPFNVIKNVFLYPFSFGKQKN